MKPYYDRDGITIYHGDCREILPQLPDNSVDLVATDPPYTNLSGGVEYTSYHSGVLGKRGTYKTQGDIWEASLDWLPLAWRVLSKGLMVFCSFHAVADVRQLIVGKPIALITWYKRNCPPSAQNAPHFTTEFIWAFQKNPGLVWKRLETFYNIPKLSTGALASAERYTDSGGRAIHPTQKPENLFMELLKVEPETILDPFLGTGTTAYCAKKLKRKCIGIEIEEKYCEIAANRCRQMVMDLTVQ